MIEQMEAKSANELLELRSKNIRSLLAAKSRGWDRAAATASTAPNASTAEQSLSDARVDQLEGQLKKMRATYEYT